VNDNFETEKCDVIFSQFFPVYRDNKTSSSAPTVITVIVLFFITFLATANGQDCGCIKVAVSFSIGSEYAVRGQWPWLVPLLKNDSDKFFCGSTIVSDRHLLTGEI
jgi:secreted trypsin-like serine protease